MVQKEKPGEKKLRFVSSGTKIVNQLMMFVVIGIVPCLFPDWIQIEHRGIVFVNVSLALVTSIFYEIWRTAREKRDKSTTFIVNAQLITSVILLTVFLHYFGYINGPFFVLYLLTIMESFLNENSTLPTFVIVTMVSATAGEFAYLTLTREIVFGFVPLLEFAVRIMSIVFMRQYGAVLADKIRSEQQAREQTIRSAERLESVTKNLKITNNKLQELSKLKDEFVSVASHELRAPMTTIKGYLSMIMDGDAGEVTPKTREYLESAFESSERMIRLVNNMLNVSRIESGRLIMSLDDIQIEEAIEEVVRGFSLEAEGHGLELKYFKPKSSLPKVRVDPDRVREVIANLIGNAINFTSHGHIHVRSKLEEDNIIVSVEDTGVGIAPDDQRELFKKFSQVGVGAPLKKGSGLGLYICKMLINEFGGEIWLKSKIGKGTTFYFSLPAIKKYQDEKEADERAQ